jgi:hypothetical protein
MSVCVYVRRASVYVVRACVFFFPCNYFNFAELFMIIKAARCFLLLSVAQLEELFFSLRRDSSLSICTQRAAQV